MSWSLSPPLLRLQAMANAIVPHGAAVVCRDSNGSLDDLYAQERAAVETAVAGRQAEFAAGRAAARAALERLGQPPGPIPVGRDRAPVWPKGFNGSISHCKDAAIAMVCSATALLGHLGVDVELAGPLEPELWPVICTRRELGNLEGFAAPGERVKLIFSIKEAVYKAQYPVTNLLLDFQDVEVAILDRDNSFTATVPGRSLPAIRGRFRTSPEYVLAFATIQAPVA